MLRILLAVACLSLCSVNASTEITMDHDITLDQIGYMLKAGFPSETIIRGIVVGRVYGNFDTEREKEFRELHASPALIELLKSGKYAGTEEQQRAEKKQRDRQEQLKVPTYVEIERQRLAQEAAERQRQQQQVEQTSMVSQQKAAAQVEANLNQRVINVLSTPVTEFGTPSADQRRVYARAKATALEQIPVEMTTTVRGDRIDGNDLERRELYQQLISDEAFVRETLR
jgi:hypothetical protein